AHARGRGGGAGGGGVESGAPRGRRRMIGLTGKRLTPEEVVAVARGDEEEELAAEAREEVAAGAAIVERLPASHEPVYGVSTGFGSLATTPIPAERRGELQRALIRSHAAGM